jgi:quinol monooxygenase YgiN
MPVVVVAIMKAKPEKIDEVREVLTRTIAEVHEEPGCQLYSLHEGDGGEFIFVEQWADPQALQTHSTATAVTNMFKAVGDHLAESPIIKTAQPLPAGDPAKGQLIS